MLSDIYNIHRDIYIFLFFANSFKLSQAIPQCNLLQQLFMYLIQSNSKQDDVR